jgi:regulator of sirC expression with transglutaminase-like and TPR domain
LKIKKYKEAEEDSDQALKIDSNHLKSISRRGTARYYLGKLRLARKDFIRILLAEPSQLIADYLKKVDEKMEKLKVEAYEKMKRRA